MSASSTPAYNYFEGMSADEISAAQNPYGGWDRETRAFGTAGGSPAPRWADFVDPLDAIGARFASRGAADAQGRPRAERGATAGICACSGSTSTSTAGRCGMRYAELVRRYHPDHNGGDRSHEKALQAVIEAYTALKGRPVFA